MTKQVLFLFVWKRHPYRDSVFSYCSVWVPSEISTAPGKINTGCHSLSQSKKQHDGGTHLVGCTSPFGWVHQCVNTSLHISGELSERVRAVALAAKFVLLGVCYCVGCVTVTGKKDVLFAAWKSLMILCVCIFKKHHSFHMMK